MFMRLKEGKLHHRNKRRPQSKRGHFLLNANCVIWWEAQLDHRINNKNSGLPRKTARAVLDELDGRLHLIRSLHSGCVCFPTQPIVSADWGPTVDLIKQQGHCPPFRLPTHPPLALARFVIQRFREVVTVRPISNTHDCLNSLKGSKNIF